MTFADLDVTWGSQGQRKAKPISFIFSHTFQLIRMKFDKVLEHLEVDILIFFWRDMMKQGK